MVKKTMNFLYQFGLLAAGSLLCAFAVKAFVMPHGFLSRGLTGFALLISYLRPEFPVGLVYFALNIPVFALGGYFVGRRFVLYSLLGLAIYSLALAFIDMELAIADPMLCAVIAGALSGLGGAALYTGYASSMQIGVMPSQGFDGIAVALLGANSPLGVVGAALFFGVLQSGKGFMNAMTDIPPEIGDTIIACIIYFAATSVLIHQWLDRAARRLAK